MTQVYRTLRVAPSDQGVLGVVIRTIDEFASPVRGRRASARSRRSGPRLPSTHIVVPDVGTAAAAWGGEADG